MYVSGATTNFAFTGSTEVCVTNPAVHFLPCEGLSLVRGISGPLFCVTMMFFLFIFLARPKESGSVNISHYARLSTQREHIHNEQFFSHSLRPSVCPSHFLPFFSPLSLSLSHFTVTFQSFYSAGQNWQRTLF